MFFYQISTLTVERDTFSGKVSDDLIIADLAKGTDATLNMMDSIDGGGGTNTLRVYGDKNIENLDTAEIKNIQKLEVVAGKDIDLNAGVVSGLESIAISKAQFSATTDNIAVTDIDGQKIAITNTSIGAEGNAILLTSKNAELNLGLSGNKVTSGVDAKIVVVGDKATTLNLDFSGAANTGNFEITNGTAEGDNSLTTLKTITVSGDQHAKFTVSAEGVTSLDASASKGGVEVSLFDANSTPPTGDIKIKGSAVDDQIWVQLGQIKSTSSFDFGAGENDVFGINYGNATDINASTNTAAVKAINATATADIIGFNQQGGSTDLDVNLSVFTNIHEFLFKDGAGVTGITNDDILNVYEDNLLVLTKATAAEASSASGAGVVNVVAMDKVGSTKAVNISNTVAWDKIDLSGDGNVVFSATLDNTADALSAAATIDATDLHGTLTVTLANAGSSVVKGGFAGDVIKSGTGGKDILTGNGGADKFDLSAITGGVGLDTQKAAMATITDFTKGDSITLTTSINTGKVVIDSATFADDTAFDAKLTGLLKASAAAVTVIQYGDNTYIVSNVDTNTSAPVTTDQIVKLNGLLDLTGATVTADVLTWA